MKFSKKVGVFPKMDVPPKKVFTFYMGSLMQRSLVVISPECMAIALPNQVLIIMEEHVLVLLVFSLPSPGNFTADALRIL